MIAERISTGRAARIVGVSSKTLLNLARGGKVPGAAELDEELWRFDEAWLRPIEIRSLIGARHDPH